MTVRSYDFGETVLYGVVGRNGYANLSGVFVSGMSDGSKVRLGMTGPTGKEIAAGFEFFGSDAGGLARIIAEAGAEADPAARGKIASELRAALVAIEAGVDAAPVDGVSDFEFPRFR